MEMLRDIRETTTELPALEMLRYLLTERFAGEVAVTASLKSPSIVVLKMISEIDPSTPVIFCHPRNVFPGSEKYRADIIRQLGLTNVKSVTGSDPFTGKHAFDFCERLWNEPAEGGRSSETIHLNDVLSPYKCWIKAAYHQRPAAPAEQRIDVYGGMVIVDVLRRRPTEAVDQFMYDHGLPHHPRVRHLKKPVQTPPDGGKEVGWYF